MRTKTHTEVETKIKASLAQVGVTISDVLLDQLTQDCIRLNLVHVLDNPQYVIQLAKRIDKAAKDGRKIRDGVQVVR